MTAAFFRQFLKDKHVAAVAPSSTHLVKRLLRHLRPSETKLIVELGPGPAVATKPILSVLPADARYLAVERNHEFAAELRKTTDPRLKVIEDDARHLKAILTAENAGRPQAIIASIPFTYLTATERTAVVDIAYESLAPGGDFIIFHQYFPLMVPYMKKRFGAVKTEFEPLNLFPCFLMHARK